MTGMTGMLFRTVMRKVFPPNLFRCGAVEWAFLGVTVRDWFLRSVRIVGVRVPPVLLAPVWLTNVMLVS